jgi:streptogramin lyase
MKRVAIALAMAMGLTLAFAFGWMTARSAALLTESSTAQAREAPLHPDGAAYEVNQDAQGHLWISDYGADEIWHIRPADGGYTRYLAIETPSDARVDTAGNLWWSEGAAGRFGQLNLSTGLATWWPAAGADALYGTQVDPDGAFWTAASGDPLLFRFRPASKELCTYTLPDGGLVDYPMALGSSIWLGDRQNGRILRLNYAAQQFTVWQLPPASSPESLSVDPAGQLWWTDSNLGQLSRLITETNALTSFDLPAGSLPFMLSSRGSEIWFTEQSYSTVGRLYPDNASGTGTTIARSQVAGPPSCSVIAPLATQEILTASGSLNWLDTAYTSLVENVAWRILQLPEGSFPWGLTILEQGVYFVDTGRQVLGRIPFQVPATVTACKVEDADGDLNTAGDRTPVEEWPVFLTVDGARQEPAQLTDADGCTDWFELSPGLNYGVEEELAAGWLALAATTYDFGNVTSGEVYSHTFVNSRYATVSACKVEDADGDLATTGDQSPVEGWAVDLRIDGVAQGLTQATGVDGCATWSDLAPGPAYGVQEGMQAGWIGLGPTSHDFGAAVSGGVYSHTFANAQIAGHTVFVPMLVR